MPRNSRDSYDWLDRPHHTECAAHEDNCRCTSTCQCECNCEELYGYDYDRHVDNMVDAALGK